MLRLLLLVLLLAGCSGSSPSPAPPAEAGPAPHYEQAFAALRVHPAVQAFAADHLAPSEPLAIEVSSEVVPLGGQARAALGDTLGDALGAGSSSAGASTDDALPLLSRRQRRPLVLFFGRLDGDRLAAQLYPNPYRREGFEAIRSGAPGLALVVVFEQGRVAEVLSGRIAPD